MTREEQKENLLRLSGTDVRKCMKCGKCSGRCPAFKEMDIKPHQFVSLLVKGKVEELLKSKAIWSCLSCMACVERCPRGVAPAAGAVYKGAVLNENVVHGKVLPLVLGVAPRRGRRWMGKRAFAALDAVRTPRRLC